MEPHYRCGLCDSSGQSTTSSLGVFPGMSRPMLLPRRGTRRNQTRLPGEIDPSELRPPSSREEAIKMMLLAERMLELGLESRGASSTDITLLKITCDLVLDSLL